MQRIPRTHDISYFIDLNDRNLLNLNPPYQRRSVWTRKDREYFIDTVMHNYPSPAIFIHRVTDEAGKAIHHVVDGKQRLETIIDFTQNKVRIPREFGDERLNGKKWDDLSPDDKRLFWDYSISVEFLPVVDEAVVNSVFERINRNSRKLTAQELRHAKFDGWFAQFVETQAADEDWETLGVVTKARSRRMADVQFLAELLIVVIKGNVVGFDQDGLDAMYAEYEDPDDALNPLSTDEIEHKFASAKTFLREMIAADSGVKDFLKALANIYTLWCWIVLNPDRPADPRTAAAKYKGFMQLVSEMSTTTRAGEPTQLEGLALVYAANARGASTDERERTARYRALGSGSQLVS